MARRYDEDQAAEILAHASRNEVERVLVGLVGAISTAYGRLALSRWRARTARKLDEATEGLARSRPSHEPLPPGSGSEDD